MENNKQPTTGNGKICYLEIPSTDIDISSSFYQKIFGWNIRQHNDGSIAFDDSVSEVSGTWILGRKPATEVGIVISIMVDSVAETLNKIVANNGGIVQPIGMDYPEITARFSDPTGNIMGLYQEPVS